MDFLVSLDDLAVLRITGDDAAAFLHAQLSHDINGIGTGEARLAAYCNPKGRMLGNLVLWRETPETGSALLALAKADIAEALLKRLRMFVLRSKVVLELTGLKVCGVSLNSHQTAGASATGTTNNDATRLLRTPPLPWALQRQGSQVFIAAPSAPNGPARWWLVGPAGTGAQHAAALGLAEHAPETWRAQDIEAGLGWVEHANLELFIPQSLNYDLNGGVSFTKGCYPGQEIVARAHFRGAVKRRGFPGSCSLPDDFALQAGMDIFDARRPGSPAGRIINAASTPGEQAARRWHVYMELNLADAAEADLRVISAEGPAVTLLPLPYPLEGGAS